MAQRNPGDPASFNHRTALLGTGRKYHFIDEYDSKTFDPVKTPTLLCIHGFPDLWYGWRYQIAPWYNAGWRVVVPDMLGYGQTDKPEEPSSYTTKALSDDLVALLDYIGVPKAVVLGHDWGSALTWRFGAWHPERCRAVVNFSIPYFPPRDDYIPLEDVVKLFPRFGYQLYFADPKNTAEMEENLEAFFASMYQTPTSKYRRSTVTLTGDLHSALPDKSIKWDKVWNGDLNEKDVRYYLDAYRKGGMTGPLNYYRTTKLRFKEEKVHNLPAALPRDIPWLFVYGERDMTCNKKLVEATRKFVPQVKVVQLKGISHWIMTEAEREVTELVMAFVKESYEQRQAKL